MMSPNISARAEDDLHSLLFFYVVFGPPVA
jgi:hypothetical protein